MKQQVSLREANQHLSRYIEAVERGEEVIITRRGKPVAKIVRVSSGLRLTGAQKLARERMLPKPLPRPTGSKPMPSSFTNKW